MPSRVGTSVVKLSMLALLLLAGFLPMSAQHDADDGTFDADTVDPYLDDDLLRLQLRPLELGKCSMEDVARLPGIGLRTAEAIVEGIDQGTIRSWSDLRRAIPIDAADVHFLRQHARLPSQRTKRSPSLVTRAEVASEGGSRRGFQAMQKRIVRTATHDDTLSIGTVFLGSPLALRIDQTFVGGPLTIMVRAGKDAGEPWFVDDTLAFSYARNEYIDTGIATTETIRRRGGSVGLAAEWDEESWSALVGDFRPSLIVPMSALFRQNVDAIRRGGVRDQRRIRLSPMHGEYGYLRGVAIRVGQTRLSQLMPAMYAAVSVRDYSTASADSTLDISTDGQRRTRTDLRRSGGVRESSAFVATSHRQRRWGIDGDVLAWTRNAPGTVSDPASGIYMEGGAWLRYGFGLLTAFVARWNTGTAVGGMMVQPLGFSGEIAAAIRGTFCSAQTRLPGGSSTPPEGVEWSLAGRWKASRGEITEVQAGLRHGPPGPTSPFGTLVTRAELRRELRIAESTVRSWVSIERNAVATTNELTSRRQSTTELTAIGGIRGEWNRGSSRMRGGVTARSIHAPRARAKLGFVGLMELRRTLAPHLVGQLRIALHCADAGVSIVDVAPSLRGRGVVTVLAGRGCRTTLEAEVSPSTHVRIAAGLDFRTRSDRSRIVDSGDDTIEATESTVLWGAVTIRH